MMNYRILTNLPNSHHWEKILLDGQNFNGIVWDESEVKQGELVYLYKKWASVHFNSDWYEIAAGFVTSDEATKRDISILNLLLGKSLKADMTLIDVNCGTGRHLMQFAEDNIIGIGMEGAKLLRNIGKQKALLNKLPLNIVSTSSYYRKKYFESADVVTSLFNSMGYTFSKNDDLKRLQWMVDLLKPGGYFLLDIRSEDYQKKLFSKPKIIKEKIYLSNNYNKTPISIETLKYWHNSILVAEEKITIEKGKNKKIVQHTTYGWRTYSFDELKDILQLVGLKYVKHKFDYYSSEANIGERLFLLGQKKHTI